MIRHDWSQFQHFWLPLVIVGGLVLLTTWLGQVSDHPLQIGGGKVGHDPDYFVDDMKAVAYDAAGVPRYHLTVKHMQHFMDDDTTTLEAPNFLRDGPGVPRMEAHSDRGTISPNGDIIYLFNDVRMRQDSLSGDLPIEVSANYLKVMPNQDRVSSNRPVTITQGSSKLSADALKADGKARTFEMDGRVKGVYEVQS